MKRLKFVKSDIKNRTINRTKIKRRKKCKYTIFQIHHLNYQHLDDPTLPEVTEIIRMKVHYCVSLLQRYKSLSLAEKRAFKDLIKNKPVYKLTKEDKETIKRLVDKKNKQTNEQTNKKRKY